MRGAGWVRRLRNPYSRSLKAVLGKASGAPPHPDRSHTCPRALVLHVLPSYHHFNFIARYMVFIFPFSLIIQCHW